MGHSTLRPLGRPGPLIPQNRQTVNVYLEHSTVRGVPGLPPLPHYVDRSKSTESHFLLQKRQQLQELRCTSKTAFRPRTGQQPFDDHRSAGERNEKASVEELFHSPTAKNRLDPNHAKRSREELRVSTKSGSSASGAQEDNIGLAGLKISTKPRCTPVTVLSSLKKERISCTCSACEDRKEKKSRLGFDREERLRQLAEQQKYADPLKDADSAFLARIRELKSYDLDTAKQEDAKKRRKNKK
ncbi:Oidioi.mRNA.OKI2018_I69.chr1.g3038.t1.cds [Oikopleura dioica]|uniref:Oidioi.mRNA.OKI2018_I69.chr1.g3038.t1.cds n=1 Tax=Oikopleura dioica TaxID=34765 RepID=A0ABN7SWU2_OIKDI|nr:Oidioi.mRNA.OKI2018_I69.chr1.g3038.t1.cds [Oikopleura dioica]